MRANPVLSAVLERYKNGEIPIDEAAQEIEGLRLERVGEFACLDLGRAVRCGMPEVVLAEGKEPEQLAEICVCHAESAGRCVVTRVTPEQAGIVQVWCRKTGISVDYRETARMLIVSKGKACVPGGGVVGIITAGTSDVRVAEEARVIAEEMGCTVRTAYDVGAAGLHRLFPALKPLLDADVFIVCAGREGTLPAVVAGLVDKPVLGVPVSTGYGYMGKGLAALASMLQSCSVIAVVNIDAGFTAGAFAARIANSAAKSGEEKA
jgi:hypothetical protein